MSNEKKFKCISQQLSMSESAPVCQHYSYASDHTLEDMLDPEYFVSQYDRLMPGDTIRIVQMEKKNIHARDNVVIAFANVTVIKSGKIKIDMHVDKVVFLKDAGVPTMDSDNTGITDDMTNKLVTRIDQRINELSVDPGEIDSMKEAMGNLHQMVVNLKAMIETPVVTHQEKVGLLKTTRRWNPGKKEHEAVIGNGDDEQVLFSHKDKDKVDEFIAKQ